MSTTVTTANAAEIVGIGYEGLRSYLKRGLLGRSGVLLPFVGQNTPAPDQSTIRSTWKRFGFTDLCLMRLAKQLIELGLTFEQANSVVSREDMRPLFREQAPIIEAILMCWPPHYDFTVFSGDDLQHMLKQLADARDVAILVNLGITAAHVRNALEGLASIE